MLGVLRVYLCECLECSVIECDGIVGQVMAPTASGAKGIIERAMVAEGIVCVFEDSLYVVERINAVLQVDRCSREADAYSGLADEIDGIPHFLYDENVAAEEAPAEAVGRSPAENGTLHSGENRRLGRTGAGGSGLLGHRACLGGHLGQLGQLGLSGARGWLVLWGDTPYTVPVRISIFFGYKKWMVGVRSRNTIKNGFFFLCIVL